MKIREKEGRTEIRGINVFKKSRKKERQTRRKKKWKVG
jgi:hypothetical protein